ncbi:MAG: pilus assembly protein PilP [Proteobacteria bacterium]|nr:pilus assembly protein PilP [Pseudomonadota bacterium]
MRRLTLTSCILLSLGLAGCADTEYNDLQAFMDEVDSRPRGAIEPLPPFQQLEPFAYQASAMRSPFEPPIVLKKVDRPEGGPKVVPDFNRTKEYLEQYTIAQLGMVGTLQQGPEERFGLVSDSDGGVHRVRQGDFMGSDHGQIEIISESTIELIEIVPDGTGGWVERSRTVSLGG